MHTSTTTKKKPLVKNQEAEISKKKKKKKKKKTRPKTKEELSKEIEDNKQIHEQNGKLWYLQATFATNKSGNSSNSPREQFGKSKYPEEHPPVFAHIPGRRNVQLSKNGKHSRGTPGWQLSPRSSRHQAPWTSNSGPRRTPCQPTHGHLGPPC